MERLLIILAVLVCTAAGVAVVAMASRRQRPPLRMDREFDEGDERFLLGSIGAPRSPIDRSAQVLEARQAESESREPRRIGGAEDTGTGPALPAPAARPDRGP